MRDRFDLTIGAYPIGTTEITYPDSQPTFRVRTPVEGREVEIVVSLRGGGDLLRLLCLMDALDRAGCTGALLQITYLCGGRTDRPMQGGDVTVAVVGRAVAGSNLRIVRTRILDPHSDVSVNSFPRGVGVYDPHYLWKHAQRFHAGAPFLAIVPDQGARSRVARWTTRYPDEISMVQMFKHRDVGTGALRFELGEAKAVEGQLCVIADDLCDGGRTFELIAGVLRAAGAATVGVAVTHGVFSRGAELVGIDTITTTDSYLPALDGGHVQMLRATTLVTTGEEIAA